MNAFLTRPLQQKKEDVSRSLAFLTISLVCREMKHGKRNCWLEQTWHEKLVTTFHCIMAVAIFHVSLWWFSLGLMENLATAKKAYTKNHHGSVKYGHVNSKEIIDLRWSEKLFLSSFMKLFGSFARLARENLDRS